MDRSDRPGSGPPRRARVSAAALALLIAVAACSNGSDDDAGRTWAPDPVEIDGLDAIATTSDQRMIVHTAGGERDFVAGVNVGATIPGHHPGELAVGREDYRRWFPMIAEAGFRAIRIYTILPPHFYEELHAHNTAHPDDPLYLLHGVWIPDEVTFLAEQDLYLDQVRLGFRAELADAVDVVFGDAVIAPRPGRASGIYTADVSPWLLGWAIGVEMDPNATFESDRRNADRPPFRGEFFVAAEASSATESWLAEMLDGLAADLAGRGVTMPLTFNNWPTTDPLVHPYEPIAIEDLVGIDANHIAPTDAWPGGLFASYHAYPYYPDFQRHEPGIADFVHAGRNDPYAGYLTALRDHHADLPLMVTEVGVPSSLGSAHAGPLRRDQGGHSEQELMRIDAELVDIIADLDLAGAMLFAWTDEWFKVTWNTIDFEIPGGRRPLWKNAWTNEQHFGLVAHDPGPGPEPMVGSDAGWDSRGAQVVHEGDGALREVAVTHDAGYLYLRLVLDDADRSDVLTVDVDVLDDQVLAPAEPGRDPAADHAVTLPPSGHGQAWVRAANDPHTIIYGLQLGYVEADPADVDPSLGVWHPQRLITNRPVVVPATGEVLAAEEFPIGELRRGTADPDHPDFDVRAVWDETDGVIRLRLPWATIGFADPSSQQALRVDPNGMLSAETVDGVGLGFALGERQVATATYTWEDWQAAEWHERPKAGLDGLAATVRRVMETG